MTPMRLLRAALLATALFLPAAHADLQGSVFTYQGKLEQSGEAVDGTRDLRFRLFDAATGGTQIGADIVLPAHPVDDGVFTAALDFGLLAFNGEARWLEIGIDGNTLAPRQLVTSAPYALYALDGAGSYSAGPGITISGSQIAARIGTTAGTVAAGDGVILDQDSGAQDADFWIDGTARASMLSAQTDAAPNSMATLLQLRGLFGLTADPMDKLRVDAAGGLVAIGQLGYGTIPFSGAGERMMWYPSKSAFRAGSATTEWDEANIGYYSTAVGNNTRASSFAAFAAGDGSVASGTGSAVFGSQNTVTGTVGFSAGANSLCSGFACVAMGFTTIAAGQGSVALGYRVEADADYSTALGQRVRSNGFEGSFIWGDYSTTSVVHANTANNQFMVRASGGVRLRTSSSLGTGCDLPAGSGVFSCTSDRNAKRDFAAMDPEETLLRVTALPVQRWRYASEPGDVAHVGPTAQDFRAAFGLGNDDVSIGLLDIDGINMLAIQALAERTDALARKTSELEAVQQRLDEVEAAIARIRAQLER